MQGIDPAQWIAQLILSHLNTLTDTAVAQARAQVPWHRAQPEAQIRTMLLADHRALAQAVLSNDSAELRAHVERETEACIQRGAPAAGLILVAGLIEEGVRKLIEEELAHDPTQAADATRRMQTLTK